MEHMKTVIGLKASPSPGSDCDEFGDCFYSSESEEEGVIQLQPLGTNSAVPSPVRPCIADFGSDDDDELPVLEIPTDQITSFDEASRRITPILGNLEEYVIPAPFKGKLYFVPEHVVSDDFSVALNEFVTARDSKALFEMLSNTDVSEFHDTVVAQIELLRFLEDPATDLSEFANKNLDSRVKALVHWVLSRNENTKVSLYHAICSAEEFVKSPEVVPISALFEDFSMSNIVHKICQHMVTLFPRHPILPSVIHKFESYDPKAAETLTLVPEDDEMSDSWDDSFFDSIQAVQKQAPLVSLQLSRGNVSNPLENCQPSAVNVVKITVAEPPKTMTYRLSDGCSQWAPNQFSDWVLAITQRVGPVKLPSKVVATRDRSVLSDPPVANTMLGPAASDQDLTPESFMNMLQYADDHQKLLSVFPTSVPPGMFALSLPLLQMLNLDAVTQIKRGCLYPKLIQEEFEGHQALQSNNEDGIRETLQCLMRLVGEVQTTPLTPLTEKRALPPLEDQETTDIVPALALCDIEFILNGRSPLTLVKISSEPGERVKMAREIRREALYHFYVSNNFSSYVSYRIAFALAVNLGEIKPVLACDFIFEALYCLLETNPRMAKLPCVRSGFLFFAVLLDKVDKYYYAALIIDAYFLTDVNDTSNSNALGQIAQRNKDRARAVFHYGQSMKALSQEGHSDSALYVSQIIVSILTDFGLIQEAIGLLSNLLNATYKTLPSGVRRVRKSMTQCGNRTLPPVRQVKSKTEAFHPTPSSVNTILSGISLADLLMKKKYFYLAGELIEELKRSTDNQAFLKLVEYIHAELFLRQNKLAQFFSALPSLNLKNKRGSTGARLTIFGASNFDTSIAAIRRIAKAYLERHMYKNAIFWAETLIAATRKTSMKDLGKAHVLRGMAFLVACENTYMRTGKIVLKVPMGQIMSSIAKYTSELQLTATELKSEALASLHTARLLFDKVGSYKKLLEASLIYVDVVLHHFFDPEDHANVQPLQVKQPNMSISLVGIPNTSNAISFDEYTVSVANLEDHLGTVCNFIEQTTAKFMHPLCIVYSQVLFAKIKTLKGKDAVAKTYFDFAYNNIRRYFACAGFIIPRNLPLLSIRELQRIVRNLCHCLLRFDKDFLNDRLIAFDWLSDIDSLMENRLRNVEAENIEPIATEVTVSSSTLKKLANVKFPDFGKTIRDSQVLGIDDSPSQFSTEESIADSLSMINANIRLAEAQKISDEEMHDRNMAICRQIENIADAHRRANATKIPVDTQYGYIVRSIPMSDHTIFLQHLFDSIYIYIPSTGLKKRVVITTTEKKQTISFTANKAQVSYSSYSGLFNSDFFSLLAMFTLCDKKQKHSTFDKRASEAICLKAKTALFGDVGNDFSEIPMIPDNIDLGDRGFFTKSIKGALCTLATSQEPLIFVTSGDLRSIPLEMMFPKQQILRCWSFVQLMLRPNIQLPNPRVTVCRWKGEASHLMESAVKRSCEEIERLLHTCGGCDDFPVPYVEETERSVCFPFPLFSSNQDNSFYVSKYKFCDFLDVRPNYFPERTSALFIFTYSDFCEMPLMLERMVSEYPFAFFMFIPAQFVRDAFREMIPIFERNEKRLALVKAHFDEAPPPEWMAANSLMIVPYDFITCLQATLIRRLGCPIALIAPTH